jgi:glycosyltransferase involved in cell wall biosynthesis
MSVYEKETPRFLSQCLNSLIQQTYKPDEVVLVEDGPISDDLVGVIDSFREKLNIVSVCLSTNSGLAVALNEGLNYCKNDLVARMDTDDVALPERFQHQVDFLEDNSDVDIVGSFAQEIDENGSFTNLRKMPISHDAIYDNLFACPFIHPSVMFNKSSILSIGGYNEALVRRQDYDLWFRCAQAGMKFYNIPEFLLLYRFTEKTHSRQSTSLMLNQAMIGYCGVRSLSQPYWKSLACFIPLVRSMLPDRLSHVVYSLMKPFDPRQKGEGL